MSQSERVLIATDRALTAVPSAGLPAVHSAGSAVAPLLPEALRVADELIRGKHKASAAVRANLCIEVIKLATRPAAGNAIPPAVVGALAALGRALGARVPVTVDAEPAEVVEPAHP